jgi:hypothetical protein
MALRRRSKRFGVLARASFDCLWLRSYNMTFTHGSQTPVPVSAAILDNSQNRLAHHIARDADQGGAAGGSVVAVYVEVDIVIGVRAQ